MRVSFALGRARPRPQGKRGRRVRLYKNYKDEQINIACLGSNNRFMTLQIVRREENRGHLELPGDATRRIVSCKWIALPVELP